MDECRCPGSATLAGGLLGPLLGFAATGAAGAADGASMTTKGGMSRARPGLPVALPLAAVLVAAAALLEPVRTFLVGSGPLTPDGAMGVDEAVFGAITSLGDGPGLVALVSVIAIALVAARRVTDAAFVVTAVAGASLIARLIKDLYDAPRPPTVDQADYVQTAIPGELVIVVVAAAVLIALVRGSGIRALAGGGIVLVVLLLQRIADRLVPITPGLDSFPSGHATSSAALAMAVILVLWSGTRWRRSLTILATVYAAGVGLSRMYLGVHYPADVIGGWCFGVAWVVTWMLAWDAVRGRVSAPSGASLEALE